MAVARGVLRALLDEGKRAVQGHSESPWRHTVNAENPIPIEQRFTTVYPWAPGTERETWCSGVGRASHAMHRGIGESRAKALAAPAKAEDVVAVELIPVGEADRLRAIEDAARYLLEVNGPDDWLAWSDAWTALEAACAVEQQETLKALGAPDEENP